MKKTLKWIRRVLWYSTLSIFVFLGVLYVSLPYFARFQSEVKNWLKDEYNVSVTFDRAHLSWDAISPMIEMRNVSVKAGKSKRSIIAKHVKIQVNLIQSLLHLKLISKDVQLSQLSLWLKENQLGNYSLEGFPEGDDKGEDFNPSGLFSTLLAYPNVNITDSTLHILPYQAQQVTISNIRMHAYETKDRTYRLRLKAVLPGPGQFDLRLQLLDNSKLQLSGYMLAESKDWKQVYAKPYYSSIGLNSGSGQVRFWFDLANGKLTSMLTQLDLKNISLTNTVDKLTINMHKINTIAKWLDHGDQGWTLEANPLDIQINENDQAGNYLKVAYKRTSAGQDFQYQLNFLDINQLQNMIQLDEQFPYDLDSIFANMQPHGFVKHLHGHVLMKENTISAYALDAAFNQVGWQNFKEIPSVSGLNGRVNVSKDQGDIRVNAPAFQIGDSQMFIAPWPKSGLNVHINWQSKQGKTIVSLPSFYLSNPWLHLFVQGTGKIDQGRFSGLSLQGGLDSYHLHEVYKQMLPKAIMDPDLFKWLEQAIISSKNLDARFVYRGNPASFPFLKNEGIFQVDSQLEGTSLSYLPDWPHIKNMDARLWINGTTLQAKMQQAQDQFGGVLQDANVTVTNLFTHLINKLKVTLGAKMTGPEATSFLRHSGLKDNFNDFFDYAKIKGNLGLNLKLDIPLGKSKEKDIIEGVVRFKNNKMDVFDGDLKFSKLSGQVQFTKDTFKSTDLKASLWDKPVQVDIKSKPDLKHPGKVLFTAAVDTILNVPYLQKQFNWPLVEYLKGESPLSAYFVIGQGQDHVVLSSNLRGIGIYLPAPFYRAPSTKSVFTTQISWGDNSKDLNFGIKFDETVFARLLYSSEAKSLVFKKGVVRFGGKKIPELPKEEGLTVRGKIPFFSIEKWLSKLKKDNQGSGDTPSELQKTAQKTIRNVAVSFSRLVLFGQVFNKATVYINARAKDWNFKFKSNDISGDVNIPYDARKKPVVARLDKLKLSKQQPKDKKEKSKTDLSLKEALDLPDFDIDIKQFIMNNQNLGRLIFRTSHVRSGIAVNRLTLKNKSLDLSLKGRWLKTGKIEDVIAQGKANSDDWGRTFSAFGLEKVMSDGVGNVDFNLHWEGGLLKPNLPTLDGELSFNLKNGQFISVNPGVGRLLGLFSLESLVRRLQLNFTDITKEGLSFDTIEGSYQIDDGVARTPKVEMTGPSLDMVLEGQIDLANETLHQTILVMPHFSTTMALAAGVVGGPVAGVLTFLADKVLSNTVLKDKGLLYTIEGPWDKPIVESAR